MGRGIGLEIQRYITGMKLVAISNRTLSGTEQAYVEAGVDSIKSLESVAQMEKNLLPPAIVSSRMI